MQRTQAGQRGEPVLLQAAAYRRLLLRLLLLPILALGLLAFTLVYGFRQVQESARRVDRVDLVIARFNNLLKLIIDEETGLRGYSITRDPNFLAPYRNANPQVEPEFRAISGLIHDKAQIARLDQMRVQFVAWEKSATAAATPGETDADLQALMLDRKRDMDAIRAIGDEFLAVEQEKRAARSLASIRIDDVSVYGLVGLAVVIAALMAWELRRLFRQLTATYNLQLEEARRKGQESFEREQWLNTTLRSIGDAVIACDPVGKVVFMNPVAEDLTGWPEKEAHGRSLIEVFPIVNQHTRAVVGNPVDAVRESGKVVGLANHTILIRRDKQEFHIDDSAAPILDGKSAMIGIVLIFRDITERYTTEQALVRTEKLASAGRLAAAIAHEVNNPLEGLVNLIYLARSAADMDHVRSYLTDADQELKRIAHITRQTLGFYRENASQDCFNRMW